MSSLPALLPELRRLGPAYLLLGLLLIMLTMLALRQPLYTFDTVPYVATILAPGYEQPQQLHAATYGLLQDRLSQPEFAALTAGDYAAALYQNPAYFASQLNMYLVKPLYVLSLRLLHRLGIDPLLSLRLMSLLPGLLFCLLLYRWARVYLAPLTAAALVTVFAVLARLPDLCRVPVPDNLSALLLFAALYLLLVARRYVPALLLLLLAVLTRSNNIIFVSALLLLLSWQHYRQGAGWSDGRLRLVLGGLGLSLAAYLWLGATYDQQWWRLFYHTFISSQLDVDAFAEPFSLALYGGVLRQALQQLVAPGGVLLSVLHAFLLLLVLALAGRWRLTLRGLFSADGLDLPQVLLLSLGVFLAFLLLFPSVLDWDRFFLPFYGFITLAALARLSEARQQPG